MLPFLVDEREAISVIGRGNGGIDYGGARDGVKFNGCCKCKDCMGEACWVNSWIDHSQVRRMRYLVPAKIVTVYKVTIQWTICMSSHNPNFRAQGLECVRNERCLFSGLEFTIGAGEVVRIEGPNGSGKTSLLRILCGLGLREAGKIFWCGREISEYESEFFAETAYVGHANAVKEELTPLENLTFARTLGCLRPGLMPRDALMQVGLEAYKTVPCRRLSAGQRRRVALARLLVTQATVWLLDEPFAALDAAAIGQFETLLRAHLEAGGLLVLVTHWPVDLGVQAVTRINLGV